MNLVKKWWFWVMILIVLLIVIFFLPRDYSPKGEVITISSSKVDCIGVGPMRCLIINGERSYESINGFKYLEVYLYVLEVNIKRIENPPADGSFLKYDLKELPPAGG